MNPNAFAAFLLVYAGAMTACGATTTVFLIAGQSNASGRAEAEDLPVDLRVQDQVRYWYDTDRGGFSSQFRDLTPLGGQFGPEIEAGRVLTDRLDSEVVFVKVAFGGTPLAQRQGTDWSDQSRDELYDKLVLNTQIALLSLQAGGEDVELGGLFWMQGESDASDASRAESYEANLTRWIGRLRNDLNEPTLPLFVGKISIGEDDQYIASGDRAFPFTPDVQTAQRAVATADPNTYFVDTEGFSLKPDLLHYDAAGQQALGAAFADVYLRSIGVPEPHAGALLGSAAAIASTCRRRP